MRVISQNVTIDGQKVATTREYVQERRSDKHETCSLPLDGLFIERRPEGWAIVRKKGARLKVLGHYQREAEAEGVVRGILGGKE